MRSLNLTLPFAWRRRGVGAAPVPLTLTNREYTSGVNETVTFANFGPAVSGTPTYTVQGSTPAGVVINALDAVITMASFISGGTFTVRRSDNNGNRDLRFVVTHIPAAFVGSDSMTSVTFGADTGSSKTISITVTGGDYNGAVISFTPANLVLADGRGFPALVPLVSLTTDANSNGTLESGDVITRTRAGFWMYPSGQTAPTITQVWRDAVASLGVTANTYAGTGSENTNVFLRETDGTVNNNSAVITKGGLLIDENFSSFADDEAPTTAGPYVYAFTNNGTSTLVKKAGPKLQISNVTAAAQRSIVHTTALPVNHFVEVVGQHADTDGQNRFYVYTGVGTTTGYFGVVQASGACSINHINASNTVTQIGSAGTWTATINTDVKVRLERDDTAQTLKLYVNDVLRNSATTETTYTGGTKIGAGLRFGAAGNPANNFIKSIKAGSL